MIKELKNETMKAIIENTLSKETFYSSVVGRKFKEFNDILSAILISENETSLRSNMKLHSKYECNLDELKKITSYYDYFDYGFGSYHMWVHEKGNKDRLLIVEL